MTARFGILPPDLEHMTWAEIGYYRRALAAEAAQAKRRRQQPQPVARTRLGRSRRR